MIWVIGQPARHWRGRVIIRHPPIICEAGHVGNETFGFRIALRGYSPTEEKIYCGWPVVIVL
jgi:hypothetical protein